MTTSTHMFRGISWRVSFAVAFLAAVVLGAEMTNVSAQEESTATVVDDSRDYPIIDNRATTPLGSYARGLSEIIRARAAYNLLSAEAMKDAAEAIRRQMRNREKWTHTYLRLGTYWQGAGTRQKPDAGQP